MDFVRFLRVAEPQQFRLGNGGNGSNGTKDRGGYLAVYPNERNGFGATVRLATAQGEGGDIHAKLSERGAHLTDDSGLVAISEIEDGALQLGLKRDSFDLKDPRRTVVKDGAFRGEPLRGPGLFRQCGNLQGIGEAVLASARFFLDGQASRRGHGRGVYDVHLFIQHGVEDAGQHGTAEQVRSDFSNFSRVANADARGARLRRLRNQRAEALGQLEIGPHAPILIGGKRGQVHRVSNDAIREVVLDLHRHLRADFFLGLGSRARDVRRGNEIGEPNERRVFRRLFGKDVHGGARKLAALQRRGKRGFVDQLSARGVDHARTLFHFGDGRRVDQVLRRGTQRGVQ